MTYTTTQPVLNLNAVQVMPPNSPDLEQTILTQVS